ncbi:TetR/AcrR family transcriptional regulator [Streptomyces durocortorensis]|uniref:TetR/AcrR family transcriptional regulator n=1 Tax=Streptomyces durocortorensis TaxID=2811104 RepID=UPI001EF5D388|nr:TetR/AcrR family transcriptional regulator [Streptomyces durocortorensis]
MPWSAGRGSADSVGRFARPAPLSRAMEKTPAAAMTTAAPTAAKFIPCVKASRAAASTASAVRSGSRAATAVAASGRELGSAPQRGLTRDRVIRAAIALVDSEGLAALSMRRVATDFGVSTMALYRHVPSKGELVRLMSEAVFDGEPPGPRPSGWRAQLEREARWLWTRYQRHPWLARAMAALTRPMASPHAMRYTERVLSALRGLGLTPNQIIHVHLALLGYAQGVAAAVELEVQARQDTGMTPEEWMASDELRLEQIQTAGSYPTLSTLFGEEEFDLELDTLFEFGLARLLDGVASLIDRSGSR